MFKTFVVTLVAITLCACASAPVSGGNPSGASSQSVSPSISAGSRIGIINLLPEEYFISYSGTLVFSDFVKTYSVPFKASAALQNAVVTAVTNAMPQAEVVIIDPPKELLETASWSNRDLFDSILGMPETRFTVREKIQGLLKSIQREHSLTGLLIVSPYSINPPFPSTFPEASSYGMYVKVVLNRHAAWAALRATTCYVDLDSFQGRLLVNEKDGADLAPFFRVFQSFKVPDSFPDDSPIYYDVVERALKVMIDAHAARAARALMQLQATPAK